VSRESFQVVEGLIDAWNRRDLDAALERMHPACEVRPAESTETLHGHDGVAAAFRDWFDAFEDFKMDVEDVSAHNDRVLVTMRQHARGKGSGLRIVERFYQLFTLRDGKVFRFEEFSEEAEALKAFAS
jgi:ketosteroid isomerase-like protein